MRAGRSERDLEVLCRAHGDRLWRPVWLSTGRPEVADDAVAEAFAQALAFRASSMGRPIYERMGDRTIAHLTGRARERGPGPS